MRWVWRGEGGGFKVEYAALVLLVTTVVVAVFAFGIPTDVRSLYDEGICRIDPDRAGCGDGTPHQGGADGEAAGEDGEEDSGDPSSGTNGGTADSADQDGNGSGSGDDEGADDEVEPAGYTIGDLGDVAEAEDELEEAEQGLTDAEDDTDAVYEELLGILADIVGITDAKACLTEGDIAACLWTIVGFTPWGKGAKLVRKLPRILDLWSSWRRTRRGIDSAQERVTSARQAVNTASQICRRNSFVSGTPVLLADGTHRPIEDVGIGERVLSTDTATGALRAAQVTDTVATAGAKEIVDVHVLGPDGSETISATDGHLFWSGGKWVAASELRPAHVLRTPSGAEAAVFSVHARTLRTTVHDLSVEENHTYYVGEDDASALVHNSGPCPDLDQLVQNSQKPAKGPGKTQAGRAYQKHRDRGELDHVPNSELKNAGQELTEEILTSPNTQVMDVTSGNAKGGVRFVMPRSGKRDIGVTFDANGNLLYFGLY